MCRLELARRNIYFRNHFLDHLAQVLSAEDHNLFCLIHRLNKNARHKFHPRHIFESTFDGVLYINRIGIPELNYLIIRSDRLFLVKPIHPLFDLLQIFRRRFRNDPLTPGLWDKNYRSSCRPYNNRSRQPLARSRFLGGAA